MLYELQVLRNGVPENDKTAALLLLDNFQYHLVGQPCCIRYYTDATKETIRILYAVGKRSYIDDADVYNINTSENYQVINDFDDTTLYWETFDKNLNYLVGIQDKVQITYTDLEQFANECELGVVTGSQIGFVNDPETGANRIYKGDEIFATTSLNDLVVSETITIDDDLEIPAGSTITDVIEEILSTAQTAEILWNDSLELNFITLSKSDYDAQIDEYISNDERNFYEIDMSAVHPDAPHGYRVGKNLIGDLYVTNIKSGEKMILNVGDFHYDSTKEDVKNMGKMSVSEIIDRILFPKNPLTNYAIITKKEIDDLFDKNWSYDPADPDIPAGGEKGHQEITHDQIDGIISILDDKLYYDKTITATTKARKVNTIVVDDTNEITD